MFDETTYVFFFFLLQMRCYETGCKADLKEPCGHDSCRAHAHCSVEVGGTLVWFHEGCSLCFDYWQTVVSPSVSLYSYCIRIFYILEMTFSIETSKIYFTFRITHVYISLLL